jgi:hypothetical protein
MLILKIFFKNKKYIILKYFLIKYTLKSITILSRETHVTTAALYPESQKSNLMVSTIHSLKGK